MKIAVGLSGGIDSTVTLLRLKEEGHHVTAVFLNMLPEGEYQEKTCCSVDSRLLAKRVASNLGVPFEVWDLTQTFQSNVINIFKAMIKKGLTPNPCVFCNRSVKIGAFVEIAMHQGFDAIATGHYARQKKGDLYKALDAWKDQSYMLALVQKQVLAKVLFPLGELTHEDVIDYAHSHGIEHVPRSSQDICFMPRGGMEQFIKQNLSQLARPGPLVFQGNIVGQHKGYPYYTVGQRRGLGVSHGEPLYVKEVDPTTNTIYVGTSAEIFSESMTVILMNQFYPLTDQAEIKIRYRSPSVPAYVKQINGPILHVRFSQPVRAITPGQIAVAYDGDKVLWAGIILNTQTSDTYNKKVGGTETHHVI